MQKICVFSFLAISSSLAAQHLAVGIKGGIPLTDAFSDFSQNSVDLTMRSFSDSKKYAVGPMLELHLPLGFSVEADGLYHPLNIVFENRVVPLGTFRSSTNITSWEFPIVGKFHLGFPIVKPYIEAGPSFRWIGSNFPYVSNHGVTFGLGVDLKIARMRIGPDIRYTRWGSDAALPRGVNFQAPSNVNQAEFLIGISF